MAHTCYRVGGSERRAGVVGCEIAKGFHQGCPRQWVSPRLPLGCWCWGQSASSYLAKGNLLVINFKSCPPERETKRIFREGRVIMGQIYKALKTRNWKEEKPQNTSRKPKWVKQAWCELVNNVSEAINGNQRSVKVAGNRKKWWGLWLSGEGREFPF